MTLTDSQVLTLAQIVHAFRNRLRMAGGQEPLPGWSNAEQWMRESARASIRAAMDPDWTPEREHERWYDERVSQGWTWGPVRDDERKINPALVHYSELPEFEKLKDEIVLLVRDVIAAVT